MCIQKKPNKTMDQIVQLLINFLGGGVIGGLYAFIMCVANNLTSFEKEDKVTAKEFLIWVLIGFIITGSFAAAILTTA